METYAYLVLDGNSNNLGKLEFNARLIKGDFIHIKGTDYEIVAVIIMDISGPGQSDVEGKSIRHNGGNLYVREVDLQSTVLANLMKF